MLTTTKPPYPVNSMTITTSSIIIIILFQSNYEVQKMYLTLNLKWSFLFCVSFSNLRHGICCCINTEASISIHISARSTALLKATFHVPLLYFEHLTLQRSLHSPVCCKQNWVLVRLAYSHHSLHYAYVLRHLL